jgi:hypothetical protein
MTSRIHRDAVTRMLRASGLLKVPEEAPLVALVKALAKEMDEGGGSRAYTAYLSALKDVRRVLAAAPGDAGVGGDELPERAAKTTATPEDASVESEDDAGVADFESFKRAKGGATSG